MLYSIGSIGLETMTASEALLAGDLVNIFSSAGAKIRKADATDDTKSADAFILLAIGSGDTGRIYGPGEVITGLVGLTAGARYYLSTTGGEVTDTPPAVAGNLVQEVGVALSTTKLLFSPKAGVTL